jgi:hypothetical protein
MRAHKFRVDFFPNALAVDRLIAGEQKRARVLLGKGVL